jgi:hypothetical protein
MSLIEALIETSHPDVYKALTEDNDEIDLTLYFMNSLITVFVGELQETSPRTAVHIFDTFLVDGDELIANLILKFIEHFEKEILNIDPDELAEYVKHHLPYECLETYPMYDLLDFEADKKVSCPEWTDLSFL